MQYNNTTLKNGLVQRVERLTQVSDGAISGDTTLLAYTTSDINETIHELISTVLNTQDDFDWDDPNRTDYPVATTPLVANQRDYQFDNISFLRINRVDVSYDGVNYYRATPFDSDSYLDGMGNDTTVDGMFSKTDPKYDPKAVGFWLYPRASATDVTNGGTVRIEYSRSFDEFTVSDTTKEVPLDRPFHELVAVGAAMKKPNIDNDLFTKLQRKWNEGTELMKTHYANRNEDMDLKLIINETLYS